MSPVLYEDVINPMADGVGVIGGFFSFEGASLSSFRRLFFGVAGAAGLTDELIDISNLKRLNLSKMKSYQYLSCISIRVPSFWPAFERLRPAELASGSCDFELFFANLDASAEGSLIS